MLKKFLSIILIFVLSFTSLSMSYAIEEPVNSKDVVKVEIDGLIYEVESKSLGNGDFEKVVTYPNGDLEVFTLVDNVLFDSEGTKIAKINIHDSKIKDNNDSNIQAMLSYVDTTYPPYPDSEYTLYQGQETGDIELYQDIRNMTTGALAIIIGIIAPPLGIIISAGLIAIAVAEGRDNKAIFYKKKLYYHKNLLSLAKKYKVQMYWDPNFREKAGDEEVYYSTFM